MNAVARMPRDPRAALEPDDPSQGHGPWNAALAAHLYRRARGEAATPTCSKGWDGNPVTRAEYCLWQCKVTLTPPPPCDACSPSP